MYPFNFHAPTRIIFGEDTVANTTDLVKELGGKRSLIVTDSNLMSSGIVSPLIDCFAASHNLESIIFDQVPPDSDISCVNMAAQLARANACDSIVAIGGGSVIDTAKVTNICLSYGGDMLEYQGVNNLPSRLKPLIVIPTTAGTGSEVSFVAMIKDSEEGKKILFGSTFLAPDIAILDPKLTISLPSRLTAATGLDALTHDLEAYVAQETTSPLSDALCLESMSLIFKHLPRATACGDDIEARAATLVASTMAGLAFTNVGVGIVHALAHALGGRFGTHHGVTNAVILPYGMEFNLPVARKKYAQAARHLGMTDTQDQDKSARRLIAAVRNLTKECGLPSRLRDLGIPTASAKDEEELACLASTDPAIMFNPRETTLRDIIDIYKRAY